MSNGIQVKRCADCNAPFARYVRKTKSKDEPTGYRVDVETDEAFYTRDKCLAHEEGES